MMISLRMSPRDFRSRAAVALREALWFVGVLMLVAFPLQRAHSSSSHFRTHEIRRSIVKHALLAPTPKSYTVQEAYRRPVSFARLLERCDESEPAITRFTIPTIPVRLFLTRLKLAPSNNGRQDPLL
jgi:hypothetical protein